LAQTDAMEIPVAVPSERFHIRQGDERYVRRLPRHVTRGIGDGKVEVTGRFREVVDLFGQGHEETLWVSDRD